MKMGRPNRLTTQQIEELKAISVEHKRLQALADAASPAVWAKANSIPRSTLARYLKEANV
jgi:hypothetical protein